MGENVDFGNLRGQNLADAKFDKDAINLRTLRRDIGILEQTMFSGVTAGSNILITGSTSAITISLSPSITATTINLSNGVVLSPVTSQPTSQTGLLWFSGNTLYLYTGNTGSDLTRVNITVV